MKKILLGTSAIVGASVLLASPVWAAERPTLKMDGWLRFEAWNVSQDAAQNPGTGSLRNNKGVYFDVDDVEIHFQGSAKADNGLEYGFYVETAETSGSGMQIDEANVFLAGNWGRLDLGAQDGVQDTWKAGGYAVQAGKDGAWDGEFPVTNPGRAFVGTDLLRGNANATNGVGNGTGTNDANKITYYSPSFGGFQLGVSYTPDYNHQMNNGYTGLSSVTTPVNDYGIGARYQGTFGGVGVLATARYEGGSVPDTTTYEDPKAWGIGTQVTYMGFSLGASYQDLGDSLLTKTSTANGADAGKWWDVGLGYVSGPYSVSAGYMNSQASNTGTTADDTVDFYTVNAGYSAAPGLDFYAEYAYVDIDAKSAATTNTANLFLIGTQVSF